jgi:hypothetical protein
MPARRYTGFDIKSLREEFSQQPGPSQHLEPISDPSDLTLGRKTRPGSFDAAADRLLTVAANKIIVRHSLQSADDRDRLRRVRQPKGVVAYARPGALEEAAPVKGVSKNGVPLFPVRDVIGMLQDGGRFKHEDAAEPRVAKVGPLGYLAVAGDQGNYADLYAPVQIEGSWMQKEADTLAETFGLERTVVVSPKILMARLYDVEQAVVEEIVAVGAGHLPESVGLTDIGLYKSVQYPAG